MTDGLRVWGPEEGAPTLMALHCTLAHGGAWKRLARRLSHRFRIVAPDLVGHGDGPKGDPGRDYHDQATETVRALLQGEPVHLIGHSFAATVALRLAIEVPDRVASLTMIEPVLFAAAPHGPARAANARVMDEMRAHLAADDTHAAARAFLALWGGGEAFDDMPPERAAYAADRMWIIPAQRAALHEDSARLLSRLDRVACPVLLMSGDASPPVIDEILDKLGAGLPNARRARIAGAGHMAPITHADEVAALIADFVETTPG